MTLKHLETLAGGIDTNPLAILMHPTLQCRETRFSQEVHAR